MQSVQDSTLSPTRLLPTNGSEPLHGSTHGVTSSETTVPSSVICVDAMRYIISIVTECHGRGGYTLDDAVRLKTSVQAIEEHLYVKRTHSTQHPDTTTTNTINGACSSLSLNHHQHLPDNIQYSLEFIFRLLYKSQRLGLLSMREAWTVYNAEEILMGTDDNKHKYTTVVS